MAGTRHSLGPLPRHRVCRASVVLPGCLRPTTRAAVARRKTSIWYYASSGARPMIVALLNQQHGVGKTTLALHLAGVWACQSHRIAVIDADPQGCALAFFEMR